MLAYYKEKEKWEASQNEFLAKKREEEAKLASLPAWKRESMMKKGLSPSASPSSSPPSPSPLSSPTSPTPPFGNRVSSITKKKNNKK